MTDLLPWDRCPLCRERVSRSCPDCYAVHAQADCRGRKHRPHPFPPVHEFAPGEGCMSRCRCGKTFSDPIHGEQPENIKRIRAALGEKP